MSNAGDVRLFISAAIKRKNALELCSQNYISCLPPNEDHSRDEESDQLNFDLPCAPVFSDRHGGAAQREFSFPRGNLHGGIHPRRSGCCVGDNYLSFFPLG